MLPGLAQLAVRAFVRFFFFLYSRATHRPCLIEVREVRACLLRGAVGSILPPLWGRAAGRQWHHVAAAFLNTFKAVRWCAVGSSSQRHTSRGARASALGAASCAGRSDLGEGNRWPPSPQARIGSDMGQVVLRLAGANACGGERFVLAAAARSFPGPARQRPALPGAVGWGLAFAAPRFPPSIQTSKDISCVHDTAAHTTVVWVRGALGLPLHVCGWEEGGVQACACVVAVGALGRRVGGRGGTVQWSSECWRQGRHTCAGLLLPGILAVGSRDAACVYVLRYVCARMCVCVDV